MFCIFCKWSYRGACFQFVPLVRHQTAYFDTLTGIFRQCDCANVFRTRYCDRLAYRDCAKQRRNELCFGFVIVPPYQWYGKICQRLIITLEPARWRRTCEAQLSKVKSKLFYTEVLSIWIVRKSLVLHLAGVVWVPIYICTHTWI